MLICKKFLWTITLGTMVAAGSAQADPWLSTDSAVRQGDTTSIIGGEFEAGELILLEITDPLDVTTAHQVEADENGQIAVDLYLDQSGKYIAEVWDAAGASQQPLASTFVAAAERMAE